MKSFISLLYILSAAGITLSLPTANPSCLARRDPALPDPGYTSGELDKRVLAGRLLSRQSNVSCSRSVILYLHTNICLSAGGSGSSQGLGASDPVPSGGKHSIGSAWPFYILRYALQASLEVRREKELVRMRYNCLVISFHMEALDYCLY